MEIKTRSPYYKPTVKQKVINPILTKPCVLPVVTDKDDWQADKEVQRGWSSKHITAWGDESYD